MFNDMRIFQILYSNHQKVGNPCCIFSVGENVKVIDHNPDAYLIYINQQNLNIAISFSVKSIKVIK